MRQKNELSITVKVIIYFVNGKWGFFRIGNYSDAQGIAEQLMAEELGLA